MVACSLDSQHPVIAIAAWPEIVTIPVANLTFHVVIPIGRYEHYVGSMAIVQCLLKVIGSRNAIGQAEAREPIGGRIGYRSHHCVRINQPMVVPEFQMIQ
jgi:hypothetical protein